MATIDVFISYAHLDNDAWLEGEEGWISILQRALQTRLSQLLGRVAHVWWDRRRLEGNHFFDDVIADACQRATVMLSVVTPRYLNSDYCRAEVEHFVEAHGVRVGNRSRLFACVKTPVERSELPPALEGRLGYEFFRYLEPNGRFREYHVHDPQLRPLFMASLDDLAQGIKKLLSDMEPRTGGGASSSIRLKQTEDVAKPQHILVATSSLDVKGVRDGVVRELSARGYPVGPASGWSEQLRAFEQELTSAAEDACLSVHILGTSFGSIPEDAESSYPVVQYEKVKQLAAQRTSRAPLARILWIAPGEVSSERQRSFLERVRRDVQIGPHDELLEGSEEELKERVLSKLEVLARLASVAAQQTQPDESDDESRGPSSLLPSDWPQAVRQVYLISDDAEAAAEVSGVQLHLSDHGLEVISSQELAEEQTEPAREAKHQELLDTCHGCLIFHGKTKVSWVRAQVDEVRKSLGRRPAPMLGHAVYVAPPLEGLKATYQVLFPKLEGGGTLEEALLPFVISLLPETSEPAPLLRRRGGADHADLA